MAAIQSDELKSEALERIEILSGTRRKCAFIDRGLHLRAMPRHDPCAAKMAALADIIAVA